MLKVVNLIVCAMLITSLGSVTAVAQTGTDPKAGSPAGAQYQLPLDAARRDAAPRRSNAGSRPSAGSGTGAGARNDAAPGQSGAGSRPSDGSGVGAGADDAGVGEGGPATQSGSASFSALRSENGFGSSSQVPGVADTTDGGTRGSSAEEEAAQAAAAARAAAAGDLARSQAQGPSRARADLLLGLGLVIAAGVAVAGRIGTFGSSRTPGAPV